MRRDVGRSGMGVILALAAGWVGCEKEPPPPPPASGRPPIARNEGSDKPVAPATDARSASPGPGATPSRAAAGHAVPALVEGNVLKLEGIAFTMPEGWTSEPVTPGPLAPVAVLKIPRQSPEGEDGSVRITHYPNMKGMDESNIERWIGQVTKTDGSPATREDAKIAVAEFGGIRVTTVDLSGSVRLTMRDQPKSDTRMIAAIVDHPRGPHFVVAAGPTKSMETWAATVEGFLKGAKIE